MKLSVAILLFPLLLLASCSKNVPCDGYTTIRFRCGDLATISRSASNIETGRTVRVAVFRSEQGADSPVLDGSRIFVMSTTYEVLADGSLSPCIVDALGNKIEGEAFDIQVPVYGLEVSYLDFYAYSPALPLKEDNSTVALSNGIDFMATAKYGEGISTSSNGRVVSFDAMQHLCSSVRFKYIYNEDQVNLTVPVGYEYPSSRPYGLSIDNLYLSGTFTLGGGQIVMPTDNITGSYITPDGTLANPSTKELTKLYGEIFILPGAADNTAANNVITFKADIVFSLPSESLTNQSRVASYPSSNAAEILVKGQRTTFNMSVRYTGPSGTNMTIKSSTTSAITPWEDGGNNGDNPIIL